MPSSAGQPARSPKSGPRTTARSIALEVLSTLETSRSGLVAADELLADVLSKSTLDTRDRGLAWELVYGVLRHRLSLDWRLDQVSDRPVARLPARVRSVLRLGAYQLLHLSRIPPSAAVNESVALVKPARTPTRDWSGYVNAVLRNLIRRPQVEMPAVETDPILALSLRYSCPVWLTARWLERHDLDGAERLCRQSVEVPPTTLRANVLRGDRAALQQTLAEAGWQVRPTRLSAAGLVLQAGPAVTALTVLPAFQQGWFYVEDEAAQLIAAIVDPKPGDRVLDVCAAPGGKATHLAARMGNHGEVIAMDVSRRRLALLEDNRTRLGASIIQPILADATRQRGEPGALPPSMDRFDRILVDAPCSGLGVLRRHPEAKWHRDEAGLAEHHATQAKILTLAADRLRPGGVLVYSTCSTEPEENEHVVEEFCRTHAEFRRESVASSLPAQAQALVTTAGDLSTAMNSESMDGFFAARLRRQ